MSGNDAVLAQFLVRLVGSDVIKLVERLEVHVPAENVAVNPPREDLEDLVVDVLFGGNSKDVIELFQSALLGFWDE